MNKFTCEKMVRTGDHEGFEYDEKPCGKPAKFELQSTGINSTMKLCGIHARKYIKAQKPWQKVMPLVNLDVENGKIVKVRRK